MNNLVIDDTNIIKKTQTLLEKHQLNSYKMVKERREEWERLKSHHSLPIQNQLRRNKWNTLMKVYFPKSDQRREAVIKDVFWEQENYR